MNNTLTGFVLAIVLVVAGPAVVSATDSKTAASLVVATTFKPAPPKKGMETIIVTVKDATGKPVKGAAVKIASNMPSMSMSGPTLTARETGNGTYKAKANLNFATMWTFDVNASANGKSGKARLSADVK